ncbi:hypothetical protein DYI22_14355 [Marinobacter lipolyticus]|uniref:Abi family protein n=1 Tax=Marinobacter lipolyticus TaxID=209639 RepID=UPI001BCBAA0A|nr:Abi family protein [Marinobacter lipolyticus]MBS8241673.1 hypothetical protein [Marinobacter lipolyticus]
MQPKNITQTHQDISVARLSSYKSMFVGTDDQELYGVYCWNEALSAALFRLIAITEVVMRNRFHSALSQALYSPSASIGTTHSNDWYNQVTLPPKSADKIKQQTHYRKNGNYILRPRQPTPNDVVSKMTFGFWPKLLDAPLSWENLVPAIVRGHRHQSANYWKKQKHLDAFYARLDLVNRLRNRIAHFEPVWKQANMLEERRQRAGYQPKVELSAPSTPMQAIGMLQLKHERATELLRWLSPSRFTDYERSYVLAHFEWLCSPEGLDAYRDFKPGQTLPITRFKRDLNSLCRAKTKVTVTRKKVGVGTYYPVIN